MDKGRRPNLLGSVGAQQGLDRQMQETRTRVRNLERAPRTQQEQSVLPSGTGVLSRISGVLGFLGHFIRQIVAATPTQWNVTAGTNIKSVDINTHGGSVLLLGYVGIDGDKSGAGMAIMDIEILDGATPLQGGIQTHRYNDTDAVDLMATIFHLDAPTAGAHTYNLNYRTTGLTGVSVLGAALIAIEIQPAS